MNNSMLTKIAMWGAVLLVLFMVFNKFDSKNLAAGATVVGYSDFLEDVKAKRIKEVTFDDSNLFVFGFTHDGNNVKG